MLSKDTLKLIEDNVRQILEPLGFDLIELKIIKSGQGMILRFLVDRIEGGITLSECTQLNHSIGQLLDEKDIISERYMLEVSSPGLDRYLIDPSDFRRTLEKRIHIFLKEQEDGKLELEGKLIKVSTNGICIINAEDKELFISFSKINKAKQAIL